MAGWGGGIGIKAKLRPAGAGAWPELGNKNKTLRKGWESFEKVQENVKKTIRKLEKC